MRATYATPPSPAEIPPGAMCPDLGISCQRQSGQSSKKRKSFRRHKISGTLVLSRKQMTEGYHKPFNTERTDFYFPPLSPTGRMRNNWLNI